MKDMKKKLCCILCACLIFSPAVSAKEAYQNYIYNYDGMAYEEPQAYTSAGQITGHSLGIESFNEPMDVFVAKDKKIYIADTGNHRIVVLDNAFRLVNMITGFVYKGQTQTFNKPQGVFVSEKNNIYIADTENARIVVLNQNGECVNIFDKPVSTYLTADFAYKPVKVAVDHAERIFVVSANTLEGIIGLDPDGQFLSFYGAIPVTVGLADAFWRMIATKEQRARTKSVIPTEYSSLDMDDGDFIFGTVSARDKDFNKANMIRKLNPLGTDVLVRNAQWAPQGDLWYYSDSTGTMIDSVFVDAVAFDHGMYGILDGRRGRVFVYDHNGFILFNFCGLGQQQGLLGKPEALDHMDDTFFIADSKYNQICVFKPTEYGELIYQATRLQYDRKYVESEEKWKAVLEFTSFSELAYVGVGRAYYRNGDYSNAMKYFMLGNDRYAHGRAFTLYRNDFFYRNFGYLMTALVVAVAGIAFLMIRKRRKRNKT